MLVIVCSTGTIYPALSISIKPLNRSVLGLWQIARKMPWTGSMLSSLVFTLRSRKPVTSSSPKTSITSVFQITPFFLKKKPSQVAQALTPSPCKRCSLLHHVEGFQDDNLCAALQTWAPLGRRDGLVERVSLDDRVATGHAQLRAITDCAIARDGFGLTGGGIAAIDERAPELTEPAG